MTWMYLNIWDQTEQIRQEGWQSDPASLYRAFEQVKDGRKDRGKRYPLALILTLLFLGKMAGEKKISGIVDWVRERKSELKQQLHWPKDFPVPSTYTDALAKCDGKELAEVIAQVLLRARAEEHCAGDPNRLQQELWQEEKLIHTAMDGKTLRGTLGHGSQEQPGVHLLSFYECESGIVLTQETVNKKENEISAATAFLQPLLVKGRIISTDAMHTQKKWCAGVHAYGGYYLVTVKENQPGVREDLQDFFEDKQADKSDWHDEKIPQKKHGRIEVREIWTSMQMNAWFEREWAGIAQVFRIRRCAKKREKEREEIIYGMTNLPRSKASAARLLHLNQQHWHIENRLHYRRDVALDEDHCQVRVKGAPEALAALNGGVLALMDYLGVSNVAKQMRHFCAHPHEALHLLLGKLSR